MKRWIKVEILQTVLSAAIIAIIVCGVILYGLPNLVNHSSSEAVKLILVVTPEDNQQTFNELEKIKIYAANENGQIDRDRNDIIELKLEPTNSSVTLSTSRITLVNGEATFTIMGTRSEIITLSANWIEGKTQLKTAVIKLDPYVHPRISH